MLAANVFGNVAEHRKARRDMARRCDRVVMGGHVHIDGRQGTVGDGAADSAGEGESGVERSTAELRRRSIDLGGHCDGCGNIKRKEELSGVVRTLGGVARVETGSQLDW